MLRLRSTTIAFLALSLAGAAACRSPRRNVRVGGDAATLKVKLLEYNPEPAAKSDLIYELSGCVAPLNGTLEEGDVLSFTSIGLKKGLVDCQVRVKTVAALSGITFAEGSEPGVLYWAKGIAIYQNAAGALEAQANLQKLFVPVQPVTGEKKAFTLKVPVKFAAPEEGRPITAALLCTPRNLEGFYPADARVEGDFTFAVSVDTPTAFDCTNVVVSAGGVLHKYKGDVADGKFTAEAGKELALKQIALVLQQTQPPPPAQPGNGDGVSVETQPSQCDPATQVFDVAKGECVPKT